tara:strand:+ start:461 stop:925 length:465 start_codon:yes stop_codon:yes gene_type:complete
MKTKIFQLLLFLLLSSCGYEAVHSKKRAINYNILIKEISFSGDRDINLKIKEKLKNYMSNGKGENFILKIYTTSDKTISSKNISGDATSYKNTVTVNVEALMGNKLENNFTVQESFKYNNASNKFDLKRYEKKIKINLSETITDNIVFKLSTMK